MENLKCDACGQTFKVDPGKQRNAKGLRCPHCLTKVALQGKKVGSFEHYIAGSKAAVKPADAKPPKKREVTVVGQVLWTVLGTLFLISCIALVIFVIATGYPFSRPLKLNPAGGSNRADSENPFAIVESFDRPSGLC